MPKNSVIRLYAIALGALAVAAAPAHAQFTPRPIGSPVVGEQYHIEATGSFWNPGAQMSVSSEGLGISGDDIDFKKDLGLTDQRFPAFRATLRPFKKHKLRFQYIPIQYTQSATVSRDLSPGNPNCFGIIFNGSCYAVNIPVKSSIDWRAYRFSYEYDFLYRERWFAGVVLDAKFTDVTAELISSDVLKDSGHARAPIPAIGGIFRAYVIPNLSITGEITGFTLPKDVVENAEGHYVDVDFYATYNVNRYVGAQFGYRSFDVGYLVDDDTGNFTLKGVYFGVVARY